MIIPRYRKRILRGGGIKWKKLGEVLWKKGSQFVKEKGKVIGRKLLNKGKKVLRQKSKQILKEVQNKALNLTRDKIKQGISQRPKASAPRENLAAVVGQIATPKPIAVTVPVPKKNKLKGMPKRQPAKRTKPLNVLVRPTPSLTAPERVKRRVRLSRRRPRRGTGYV